MGVYHECQPALYYTLLFPSSAFFSTPISAFPLVILPVKQLHDTAVFMPAGMPWRLAPVGEQSLVELLAGRILL